MILDGKLPGILDQVRVHAPRLASSPTPRHRIAIATVAPTRVSSNMQGR